jgi:hypothetical protein
MWSWRMVHVIFLDLFLYYFLLHTLEVKFGFYKQILNIINLILLDFIYEYI